MLPTPSSANRPPPQRLQGPLRFRSTSAVERAGLNRLNEGQKISYEVVADPRRGKSSAEKLKAL
jgi:hypothetical protein